MIHETEQSKLTVDFIEKLGFDAKNVFRVEIVGGELKIEYRDPDDPSVRIIKTFNFWE